MQATCSAIRLKWPMIVLPCIGASRGFLGYFITNTYNAPMDEGVVCQ